MQQEPTISPPTRLYYDIHIYIYETYTNAKHMNAIYKQTKQLLFFLIYLHTHTHIYKLLLNVV